jgi:hypothetical protein
MTDIRNVMILDQDEIERALAREVALRTGVPEVCICGHAARAHSSNARADNLLHRSFREAGQDRCMPGRMACPCEGYRGVVRADSVRGFLYRTTGAYGSHALSKGIANALGKGLKVEPLGVWSCDMCGGLDKVGPVPVTRAGRESYEPQPKNFLLCAVCVERLRLGTLFTGITPAQS